MAAMVVCLTHDVDRVYKSYQYLTRDLRGRNWGGFRRAFRGNPYWNFERIMAIEERYGARSTFFFLEESLPFRVFSPRSWELAVGKYRFSDPPVARIIRTLDEGGWEIGLHGSYHSFQSEELLAREKASLEEVLGKPVLGIRQHYLNLEIPGTWVKQKNVGLLYDSSLGLKQTVGFPNNAYRPFVDSSSGMLVLPLALMDGYLFGMSKTVDEAWERTRRLIDEAQEHEAVLVVLWHQRVFDEHDFPGYRDIYERLIAECADRGARFVLCRDILEQKDVWCLKSR